LSEGIVHAASARALIRIKYWIIARRRTAGIGSAVRAARIASGDKRLAFSSISGQG
jgi:hypothetical protein